MRPMLATPGGLPAGAEWAYEVKWDGIRALLGTPRGGLTVTGRSGSDQTRAFPELAGMAPSLPADSLVDGELVVMADGGPSFHSLIPRLHADTRRAAALARRAPATLLVFDLLLLGGRDVTDHPYDERRDLLASLDLDGASWQVPSSFDDGPALWEATSAQGLEGVVAKRRASRYHPGVRHPDWVKVAHRRTRSFVVGGHRPGSSPGPGRIGSLLVGTPVGDGLLHYDGAVGSGLSAAVQRAVRTILDETATSIPAFDTLDLLPGDGVWCEPIVVVDVAHLGRGGNGLLRQPSVARVRPDRSYADLLTDGS